ncbi:50S ribosomal protein L18e [Candidatus Micrarchaeota archaeon CG10_big_fil_rev_8_21_14_0_10_45_29]|nr:MAG: 50S ribosomal protein L18e [Candidatus Micrarchaeota archaeon CG10_big_fil_rev_8_21_14_0_10_45_29]
MKRANNKTSAGFWKRADDALSKPVRARKAMNLSRLSRITKKDEMVLIAGKVLGDGELSHPLTIAALGFSKSALDAIKRAGGKIATVAQLREKNPKGEGLRILI